MKKILTILATTLTISTYAQITYQPGYFITKQGEKTNCLIRNVDWVNNPTSIEYKVNENTEPIIANTLDILEFSINNEVKYIAANVAIDYDSHESNDLIKNRNVNLEQKDLFLKEIVSGKATLYKYTKNTVTRYYYKLDQGNITYLIYKPYLTESGKIGYNLAYQQELSAQLNCENISKSDILNLKYKEENLTKLVKKYNKCANPETIEPETEKAKGKLSISIKPRVNFSVLKEANQSAIRLKEDVNATNLGIGAEFEYVLPFRSNKWSVVVEPNYSGFKSDINNLAAEIKYNVIEAPIGLRYGMFINENSKIFLNVFYVLNLNLGSEIKFNDTNRNPNILEITNNNSYAFGAGYKYKNKYSVEFRVNTKQKLDIEYYNTNSSVNLSNISLILGYTIF